MAVVKFDVSKTDPKDALAGGGEQAKPGVYKAKVVSLVPGHKQTDGKPDKSQPRLEVQVQIMKGRKPSKFAILYDYIAFSEASQWKLDQFLQTFGLASTKKRKGQFKTESIVGKEFRLRVKGDTYEGEYKAKVGAYMPLDEDEDDDEFDDDDELEEDDEEEIDDDDLDDDDEEDDDENDDDDDDDGDEEDGEYTEEGLGEMSLSELKEVAAEFEVKARGKAKLIAAILEAQEEAEEEDEDDDEAEVEAEYAMEDLDDMKLSEIKGIFEENDFELPKKKTKAALIAALVETGIVEEDDEDEPF